MFIQFWECERAVRAPPPSPGCQLVSRVTTWLRNNEALLSSLLCQAPHRKRLKRGTTALQALWVSYGLAKGTTVRYCLPSLSATDHSLGMVSPVEVQCGGLSSSVKGNFNTQSPCSLEIISFYHSPRAEHAPMCHPSSDREGS